MAQLQPTTFELDLLLQRTPWNNPANDNPAPSSADVLTPEDPILPLRHIFHKVTDLSNPSIGSRWLQTSVCQPLLVKNVQGKRVEIIVERKPFVPYAMPHDWPEAVQATTHNSAIDHLRTPPYDWSVYNDVAHNIVKAMIPLSHTYNGQSRLEDCAEQVIEFGLRSEAHAHAAPLLARALVHVLKSWSNGLSEDKHWCQLSISFARALRKCSVKVLCNFWKPVSSIVSETLRFDINLILYTRMAYGRWPPAISNSTASC